MRLASDEKESPRSSKRPSPSTLEGNLNNKQSEEVLVLFPTWRSQIAKLFLFFLLCIITVTVSILWPQYTVIKGKLFEIGSSVYYLHLPILALAPGFVLGQILLAVFDAEYIIDNSGVEARVGLVSFSLIQPRLRYEDIRGVEPKQTLTERILGIGTLLVGSAMMSDVEIVMVGVPNPRAIQQYINRRRDLARGIVRPSES